MAWSKEQLEKYRATMKERAKAHAAINKSDSQLNQAPTPSVIAGGYIAEPAVAPANVDIYKIEAKAYRDGLTAALHEVINMLIREVR